MKYIDRKGNQREENSFQDRFLQMMYGHVLGRMLIRPFASPAFSKLGGRVLDSRFSARFVKSFIKHHRIELNQYEKQEFFSYNDFFTRKIKAWRRPIAKSEEALISPSDGKLSVYPVEEGGRFTIKHTPYTVAGLLRSRKAARRYLGGYVVVLRLTVDDYHRYCYVADAEKSKQKRIEGIFHTVNPAANDAVAIYKTNTREYCFLKTKRFGTLAVMEVGALLVGKINNYKKRRCLVQRGEEKGRFEFGGSTIVLLIEKGKVQMDPDLIRNTENGYETIVRLGEQIGREAAAR